MNYSAIVRLQSRLFKGAVYRLYVGNSQRRARLFLATKAMRERLQSVLAETKVLLAAPDAERDAERVDILLEEANALPVSIDAEAITCGLNGVDGYQIAGAAPSLDVFIANAPSAMFNEAVALIRQTLYAPEDAQTLEPGAFVN